MRMILCVVGFCCVVWPALAQDADAPAPPAPDAAALPEGDLLTSEELQTLVAPVALYPDTLLIQIFVAATEPLEIVKAERFLLDNADRDPAELEPDIEAQGWDPSVAVLATAFPEVVGEMATHIDWTETMGTAMLAQSDDVLDAVQIMRNLAIDSGALISGEEQSVSLVEDASAAQEVVVITPTDPEVVYVPQYVPEQVYSGPSAGDIIGASLLTFGTVALIDEIFDDDDDWDDYWGCRNCGGWGGGPIIRDPDIDIDVDGNVNIGNEIDLGDRTNIGDRIEGGDDVAIGDRVDLENRPEIGWTPDEDRAQDARDKLSDRKTPEGVADRLPVTRPEGRSEELRQQLSQRTGATDISRPEARDAAGGIAAGVAAGAAGAAVANRGTGRLPQVTRDAASPERAKAKADAIAKTREAPQAAQVKKKVAAKPKTASKPQIKKPTQTIQRKSAAQGLKKKSGGNATRKASSRGKSAKKKIKKRR